MVFEYLAQILWKYQSLLTQFPYLFALTILVTFYISSKMVLFIIENYLIKMAEKTISKADDLILSRIKRPISIILLLLGLRLSFFPLNLNEYAILLFEKSISTFTILLSALIVITIVDTLIDSWGLSIAKKTKSRIDKNLLGLFHKISRVVFLLLALVFILGVWGVQTGPLIASLGVAGIAVAFAMQSTLGNLFGGISLIIDKSIKSGDVIELDASTKGVVVDVGLRSTRIRTFNNEMIIIPNGKLADSKIKNHAPPDPSARLVVPFSTAYGSKIEGVKKLAIDCVRGIKGTLKDPAPYVRFIEMGDSALSFKLYIWVEDYSERFSIKDIVNIKLYDALNKAKINIPFPQMDVHLKKE